MTALPSSSSPCPRRLLTLAFLPWVLASGACGRHPGDEEEQAAPPEPVAQVSVVLARQGILTAEERDYGTVVAALGQTRVVAAPCETRVRSLAVIAGQTVAAGAPLATVEPTAAALVEVEQARALLKAETAKAAAVEERFALGLATREERAGQEQALEAARAGSAALDRFGQTVTLGAPAAGTVDQVPVREGELVPAGTPLVEVVSGGRLQVRLWGSPEAVAALHEGGAVTLSPVDRPAAAPLEATVAQVSRRLDPQTRLVEVVLTPPAGADLLLSESWQALLAVASAPGVIVPRRAVLPVEGQQVLFTVSGGRAVRHLVQVDLTTAEEALVRGDLAPGDSVAVLGNYELEDGMRVQLEAAAATRPGDDR